MIYNIPQSLIESATSVLLGHLTEGKVDDLKAQNPHMSNEIDAYSNLDSTPTKKFVPWLVSQHKKGNVTPGDSSIKGVLDGFEKYKSKHGIKDHSGMTYDQVKTAVEPHIGSAATKKEQEHQDNNEGIEELPQIKIFHIKTKKAAQNVYGGGTKLGGNHTNWCVAARGNDNHFGSYGDLYTIHVPHDENSPYAYHPFHGHVTDRHNDPDNKEGMHETPADKAIAKNPELHSSIKMIDRMVKTKKDTYNDFFNKLNDENTSAHEIGKIYKFAHENSYGDMLISTIWHPSTPAEVLHSAATNLPSNDYGLSSDIATHPNVSPKTIDHLLSNTNEEIRRTAVGHKNSSKENLMKAMQDKSEKVRDAAKNHPRAKEFGLV